jgi:ADP-ribosyl-[dinitrogen reductase] hydrolase
MTTTVLSRAQGCLLGQLCGDALGSLVEFQTPAQIRKRYPKGVRDLEDGGTWNTLAGQPTDDSELALALARSLAAERTYNLSSVRKAYQNWLASGPFDCGMATRRGIGGNPDPNTQANGALMRISPLGIFGAYHEILAVEEWARLDASITHPHRVCGDCNALFAGSLAVIVKSGASPSAAYDRLLTNADRLDVCAEVRRTAISSAKTPPADYVTKQGWVLVAFGNAIYQLLHAASAEEAIVDTIMRGGDTDTNAAICGALVGAVHGIECLPDRWVKTVLSCRPAFDNARARQPRPEAYWPADALSLAPRLMSQTR